jgi:hypothetical protein
VLRHRDTQHIAIFVAGRGRAQREPPAREAPQALGARDPERAVGSEGEVAHRAAQIQLAPRAGRVAHAHAAAVAHRPARVGTRRDGGGAGLVGGRRSEPPARRSRRAALHRRRGGDGQQREQHSDCAARNPTHAKQREQVACRVARALAARRVVAVKRAPHVASNASPRGSLTPWAH